MRMFLPLLPFLVLAISTFSQDLVSVAPKNVKIEYEDARVRVERLNIAPREVLPMHDRPQRVVVTLTANDVLLTSADGKTHNTRVPAGNIAWAAPGKRSVTNFDIPVENIVIDIKNATEPAQPILQPPSHDDPRALIEPHHHWVFENQYVRVYDVRLPSGQATEFHTHSYDTVAVLLSDRITSDQRQGGGWSKPSRSKKSAVEFHHYSSDPVTHRVRNDGDSEFRVVLVELKR
jgi:hypothetical protein